MPPSDPRLLPALAISRFRFGQWPLVWLSSIVLYAASAAVHAEPPTGTANPAAWPAETMRTAIEGCRASILEHAFVDYRRRNHLPEPTLEERRKMLDQVGNQSNGLTEYAQSACVCIITNLSKRWTYEYVASHPEEARQQTDDLIKSECSPANRQAPTK
jgi:hypothetical protein